MVRILPYHEASLVSFSESNPPHERAVSLAREHLEACYGQSVIEGGIVYGSAVFEGATPTSDIDIMVAVADRDLATLLKLRHFTRALYAETGVFAELVAYTLNELSAGTHGIRDTMIEYLREQAQLTPENCIGESFVDLIVPEGQNNISYVDRYFMAELFGLQNRYTWSPLREPELLLETILNIPNRAGRKSISALQVEGIVGKNAMPDVRKATIEHAVAELYGPLQPAIIPAYQAVAADAKRYNTLLQEVASGRIGHEEYDHMIEATIYANAPRVFTLLPAMHAAFRRYVPGHTNLPPS